MLKPVLGVIPHRRETIVTKKLTPLAVYPPGLKINNQPVGAFCGKKKIDVSIFLWMIYLFITSNNVLRNGWQTLMETDEQNNGRKTIAVVIPVFNEQDNVDTLCDRLCNLIASQGMYRWKLVFVDDGSKDATTDRLKARLDGGLPISIIRFHEFRPSGRIKAGLDFVDADAVITMDGDGQHPPELIPKLLETLAGRQSGRTRPWRAPVQDRELGLRWKLSKVAYAIINWFADRPIPPECADFRLIDRVILNE